MKQQRGGTVLGLIIGVIIGLGGALAVAVYITKVPIPFLNKGQSRSNDQDAAEARKNKDWDPNAPLYGKNPARPTVLAPAASAPMAQPSAPAAQPAAVAAIGKSGTASTTPDPKVAAKPENRAVQPTDAIGDLAKARSTTGGVDPFSYFVQVGAYRTAEDAESQRAKLSLGGIEARVSEREQSGRTVYRVRVGPMDKREDADKTKERLEALGMEAALVRVQR